MSFNRSLLSQITKDLEDKKKPSKPAAVKQQTTAQSNPYYIGKSDIQGKGAFAKQFIPKGSTVDMLHQINMPGVDYDFTELGRSYNHAEDPNTVNKLVGNKRYMVAKEDIYPGQELTGDYRMQPDLEQPQEDWQMKNGGMIKRKDGSYSKRGLWDNIRANRGSGKKPTKEMLKQERKIRAEEKAFGGQTDDEREMVTGIADILSQVKNKANRAAIAKNMMADFQREGVTYNPSEFLRMSNMKKGGSTFSGNIWFQEGGMVDLQKQYGIDPLSKIGIQKAQELAAKNPNLKFVCTAEGCAQIAADAAEAFGQNFYRGNAWDMGNTNNVNYLNPTYAPFMGQNGPLPNPKGYNVPKEIQKGSMMMVGLNRNNNLYNDDHKKLPINDANIKAGLSKDKTNANDSYDYANRLLYPDSRGYEHVGFLLGNGKLLHGTGKGKDHPAFYTIDDMKDGIALPGYGGYEAVETISPASMWQKVVNKFKSFKGGGSTYSGGLWYQLGGEADILAQANADLLQTDQMNGVRPETLSGAANAVFGQQLQNRVASENPALKIKPGFNGVLGNIQNKLMEQNSNPYSLTNIAGMAADVIDGFNNQKKMKEALDKQRMSYSTDQAYQVQGTNDTSRGVYDMYNQFIPNKIGGNMSFMGMNQKYSMQDGGAIDTNNIDMSFIRPDLNYTPAQPFINMDTPLFETPSFPTDATRVDKASIPPLKLDTNFQDYAAKAQSYLDRVAPHTDITGEALAAGAQAAYEKYGRTVPVKLALAQLQVEGYLAKGSKPNKPQRTKNPFNVGNTDTGAVVNHGNLQSGVNAYYDLMARSYLAKKTPEQLLENFTNSSGNRYATAGVYERALRNTINGMKFQEGGVVEMSEDELNEFLKMGGEVEFC